MVAMTGILESQSDFVAISYALTFQLRALLWKVQKLPTRNAAVLNFSASISSTQRLRSFLPAEHTVMFGVMP